MGIIKPSIMWVYLFNKRCLYSLDVSFFIILKKSVLSNIFIPCLHELKETEFDQFGVNEYNSSFMSFVLLVVFLIQIEYSHPFNFLDVTKMKFEDFT